MPPAGRNRIVSGMFLKKSTMLLKNVAPAMHACMHVERLEALFQKNFRPGANSIRVQGLMISAHQNFPKKR